jgi:hypothetical protein
MTAAEKLLELHKAARLKRNLIAYSRPQMSRLQAACLLPALAKVVEAARALRDEETSPVRCHVMLATRRTQLDDALAALEKELNCE